MKIGVFVSNVAVEPGEQEIVSGHVQVPLRTAQLLRQAGHEVTIITTRIPTGRVLPACFPNGISMTQIANPARQGNRLIREQGHQPGAQSAGLVRALRDLAYQLKSERFDVIHFFGGNGTAHLAGAFGFIAPRCPIIATIDTAVLPERRFWMTQHLWRRIDCVLSSTEYSCQQLDSHGVPAQLVKHGIVRSMAREPDHPGSRKRHRVLFWREATWRNGGDLAIEVFRKLAPQFPQIQFDFALRPHWKQDPGIQELAAAIPNIAVHMAPYASGPTLQQLIAESICVLQPFRSFTIHPQLSILESLAAGVPVVACDVESTRELILDGQNGYVAPVDDVNALATAIERLLRDPGAAATMGQRAIMEVERRWHWHDYVPSLSRHYEQALDCRQRQPGRRTG